MYVTDVTYEDFYGNKRTETLCFHLTKAELTELEMSHDGGYSVYATRVIKSGKTSEIFPLLKDWICRGYGVKSDDGSRFVKSPAILNDFLNSLAYDKFIMELFENPDKAADFYTKMMPTDVQNYAREHSAEIRSKAAELVGGGDNA